MSRKIGGETHRVWTHCEQVVHPFAFKVPSGTPVIERDGRLWSSDYPVLGLFWPKRYYQVFVLYKPTGVEYYCNVIAPIEYTPAHGDLTFVDLDLDVFVSGNAPEVLDEDEFESNRENYSPATLRDARQAVIDLCELARAQRGPFAPAAASLWRARVNMS